MVLSSAHSRGRTPPDASPRPASDASVRPRQAEMLRRHGIRLDKRLGQHFLVDARVPDRIAALVAALRPDRVVELASGAGALTFALLEQGWPVHALELDRRMIDLLREEVGGAFAAADFGIEAADLARFDFEALLDRLVTARGDAETPGPRIVFAGNLPYQVTSPVLFGLLPALRRPEVAGAVVMVQAEVAQRMAAAPGGRAYGVLSVMLQAELEIHRAFTVKPGAFLPPPEVDSAVVELRHRGDPVRFDPATRSLVRTLFQQRRKQIGGVLRRRLDLTESDLSGALHAVGLDPRVRPESLRPEQFVILGTALETVRPDWAGAFDDAPDEETR